jgi:rare lipoprotein A
MPAMSSAGGSMAQGNRVVSSISAVLLAAILFIPLTSFVAKAASQAPSSLPSSATVHKKTHAKTTHAKTSHAATSDAKTTDGKTQVGLASYYGRKHRGKKTASGKHFNDHDLTAAHRSLPLDSKAKVTDLKTGKSVDVTITDRGPYKRGRVIDLSQEAAKEIGIDKKDGVDPVKVEPAGGGQTASAPQEKP